MIEPAFFIGEPINFKDICKVYPPTVKDVITNSHFGSYASLLLQSQEDLEDQLLESLKPNEHIPTPLEFLLANCFQYKELELLAHEAFSLFLHDEVTFLYEQKWILIGNVETLLANNTKIEDIHYISEDNFFDLQNLIRAAIGLKQVQPPTPPDVHEDPRITRMKKKARLRDRIKAKQGVKGGISFNACIAALCCMGIGLTPMNIGNMSYVAVNDLISIYQGREKYDIDIKSLLAGASSNKVKPVYWIRNFDDN